MSMHRPLYAGVVLAAALSSALHAQTATVFCVTSANTPLVSSEGLSERMGDIVFDCTSAQAGVEVTMNLSLFLNIPVTNKLEIGTGYLDVIAALDTGAGLVVLPNRAQPLTGSSVTFAGIHFTIPPSRRAYLRIINLRGAVATLGVSNTSSVVMTSSIQASNVQVQGGQLVVASPQRGLLATYLSTGIRCVGSPLPQAVYAIEGLLAAGTRFFTSRVTEGFPTAFETKSALTDTGTRVTFRYSGFPAGARLFVPDVVVGSNGFEPTAMGDLGGITSGGKFVPGSDALVFARVINAKADGSGGTPYFNPPPSPSPQIDFATVSEVTLTGGAGTVTFEVVSTAPAIRESAQIPTFIGMPPVATSEAVVAQFDIGLSPVSTISTYSPSASVPRFVDVSPPSDCPALEDCNAPYFPRLRLSGEPLNYTAIRNGAPQFRYLRILNDGGGQLYWTASIRYQDGAGWLRVDAESGIGQATIRIDTVPGSLAIGTYEATLTIDGGPLAGLFDVPVKLTITDLIPGPGPGPGPGPSPSVTITGVENAARPNWESVAPGSIANVKGSGLVLATGTTVEPPLVRFDGIPAQVLNASDSMVVVEVPPALSGRSGVLVTATLGTVTSRPRYVEIREVSPGIFNVLNADNFPNSLTTPAFAGDPIQVFTTGLLSNPAGPVTVRLHDRELIPLYSGNVTGLIGLNQVNIGVPADLPEMQTEVLVCGATAGRPDEPACSLPAKIWLRTR